MRILLDEMLPAAVATLLPDHTVVTVRKAGYAGLVNGDLMRRAVTDAFAILVTADQNLPAQQSVRVIGIAVVRVRGGRMARIEPQAARIRAAVARASAGTVTRVEPG